MNQTNQLSVRRAELADAEPLVELASRIYYETFAAVNTPENLQAYVSSAFTVKQLRAELNEPEAAFYIVEVDGTFAAYAKLLTGQPPECVTGPSPIELVRFYVDRRWQGTGVAGRFLEPVSSTQASRLQYNVSGRVGAQRLSNSLLSKVGIRARRRTHLSNGRRSTDRSVDDAAAIA